MVNKNSTKWLQFLNIASTYTQPNETTYCLQTPVAAVAYRLGITQ